MTLKRLKAYVTLYKMGYIEEVSWEGLKEYDEWHKEADEYAKDMDL